MVYRALMRSPHLGLILVTLLSACSERGEATSPDARSPALRALDVDPTLPTLADPAWVPAASMGTARSEHDATLLQSGKVLVVGGPDATVEIYDRATDTWSPGAPMSGPRKGQTTTLLPSGKVLVVGGEAALGATVEIYDPALDTWTLAAPMSVRREGHTATLLPSGKVLVTGGAVHAYSTPSSFVLMTELYDPATDTWTPAAPLAHGRQGSTATLLPNGTVLIADGTFEPEPPGSCEIYDPGSNTFSPTGALLTPHVTPRAALLQNGKVLVAGGDGNWFKHDPLPASNVAERVVFGNACNLYKKAPQYANPPERRWQQLGAGLEQIAHAANLKRVGLGNAKVAAAGHNQARVRRTLRISQLGFFGADVCESKGGLERAVPPAHSDELRSDAAGGQSRAGQKSRNHGDRKERSGRRPSQR